MRNHKRNCSRNFFPPNEETNSVRNRSNIIGVEQLYRNRWIYPLTFIGGRLLIVIKKPGASWRTAENFKYPSWQQPKLSARIYRAAAHVFPLLCTRMPRTTEEKKRREKKEKVHTHTYIYKKKHGNACHWLVVVQPSLHLVRGIVVTIQRDKDREMIFR